MLPEYMQFLAFYLLTIALLKIVSAWLHDKSPGSSFANAFAWFTPGLA